MKTAGITILIAFFTAWTISSFAQSEQNLEREVIIIKEKIDADGKKTVKKLIKRGYNITDQDIQSMMDELDLESDYQIKKGQRHGHQEIEIDIDSDELSEKEVQKILEDLEVNGEDMKSTKNVEIKVIKKTDNGEEVEEKIIRRSNMGSKPRLGIMIESVQNKKGIKIKEIIPNSPAASSELKAGDTITKVDNKEVNKVADLMALLNEKKEGENISIEYLRNKETKVTDVELTTMETGQMKKVIRKEIKE